MWQMYAPFSRPSTAFKISTQDNHSVRTYWAHESFLPTKRTPCLLISMPSMSRSISPSLHSGKVSRVSNMRSQFLMVSITLSPLKMLNTTLGVNPKCAHCTSIDDPYWAASLPAGTRTEYSSGVLRSEERRVGQECVGTFRFRWSPEH